MTGAIGIDVGGTKVLGVRLDDAGAIADEHRVPTPRGADAIVAAIAAVAGQLRQPGVDAIGVGLPGLVSADGVLRFAPNLPGVVEVPFRVRLEAALPGATVRLENDASCAAWGERLRGAGAGADHMLLVTLGTGIGGGIITDGRLYRGANGFAGEIGHMVVNPHGPPCPCGQRGCWERYASGSGLGRIAREAAHAGQSGRAVELAGGDPEDVRGEHVVSAAREGDADALGVMQRFSWWLALGLANLANAFDPERFVIGGGLVEAGVIVLDPTRAAFTDLVEAAQHRPEVEIVAASLGERAGAIGAALLATS